MVNHSVTYSNYLGKDLQNNGVSVNLSGTHFSFSYIFNRFASVGCNSLATFLRSPMDDYPVRGCLQPRCGNTVMSSVSQHFHQISLPLLQTWRTFIPAMSRRDRVDLLSLLTHISLIHSSQWIQTVMA
ncbi:hypothetical protein V6N13_047246 [Hibiscus sabdariffa]